MSMSYQDCQKIGSALADQLASLVGATPQPAQQSFVNPKSTRAAMESQLAAANIEGRLASIASEIQDIVGSAEEPVVIVVAK